MLEEISFTGIIPARYGSSRFPGKPLAQILGEPMFYHVFKQAKKCLILQNIYLATDSDKIAQKAQKWNVPTVLTSPDHSSGTDRILEAATKLSLPNNSVILNIQGDEPALKPKMLEELISPFSDPRTCVSTLARTLTDQEADNPNLVKVVTDLRGRAIYFSRSKIPYFRKKSPRLYLGHIGLYAYKYKTLQLFKELQPSPLEITESLEQLRLIEAGVPIQVVSTDEISHGVDRPEDIPIIEEILKKEKD